MKEERLCLRLKIKEYPTYLMFSEGKMYRYKNGSSPTLMYNFALAEDYKLTQGEQIPNSLPSKEMEYAKKVGYYIYRLFWMTLELHPLGMIAYSLVILFIGFGSVYVLIDVPKLVIHGLIKRKRGKDVGKKGRSGH